MPGMRRSGLARPMGERGRRLPTELGLLSIRDPHLDVQLYRIDLEDHLWDIADLSLSLSDAERERADRYIAPRAREYFIVRRAVLRSILGSHLGLPGSEVELHVLPSGKPTVSASGLGFSVSSSGSLALIACSWGRDVGADIEVIVPIREGRAIARRLFSPAEIEALDSLAGEEYLRTFFRIWTRKEALVKALGHGLSDELSSYTVLDRTIANRLPASGAAQPQGTRWKIEDVEVGQEARAAVCVLDGAGEIE